MAEVVGPYENNSHLENSPLNLRFSDLKKFGEQELADWVEQFANEAVHAWDHLGIPIVGGQSEDNVIDDFKRLLSGDPYRMERLDELTAKRDCIENTYSFGATCNQFFPTMLKTKDITSNSFAGASIYSYFAEQHRRPQLLSAVRKLLDIDPLQAYSKPVIGYSNYQQWRGADPDISRDAFWVHQNKSPKVDQLVLSKSEIAELVDAGEIAPEQICGDGDHFTFQVYNPESRIMDFPRLWRVLFDGSPATNFPPFIAKYLYQRFAAPKEPDTTAIVYDPSAGWGGRILGAMSCAGTKRIHYIGTDPNSDHWIPELNQTKYEYLADYFNSNTRANPKNTCEIFRCGSEDIAHEAAFQIYRGKVDFVFTSPPYFAAEGYTDEPTQSHIKFPTYDEWIKGFLEPTLETAEEWLRPGGYLCLNIADIRISRKVLPLQTDAISILTKLGMARHPDIKMVLKDAPKGSKRTDSGIPTTRNFCKILGKLRKYEPILVFQKLIDDDFD